MDGDHSLNFDDVCRHVGRLYLLAQRDLERLETVYRARLAEKIAECEHLEQRLRQTERS